MEVGWFSAGAKSRGNNTFGASRRNGHDMASFAFPGSAPASVRHFNETRENRSSARQLSADVSSRISSKSVRDLPQNPFWGCASLF
jgi:hypothetical protein